MDAEAAGGEVGAGGRAPSRERRGEPIEGRRASAAMMVARNKRWGPVRCPVGLDGVIDGTPAIKLPQMCRNGLARLLDTCLDTHLAKSNCGTQRQGLTGN